MLIFIIILVSSVENSLYPHFLVNIFDFSFRYSESYIFNYSVKQNDFGIYKQRAFYYEFLFTQSNAAPDFSSASPEKSSNPAGRWGDILSSPIFKISRYSAPSAPTTLAP